MSQPFPSLRLSAALSVSLAVLAGCGGPGVDLGRVTGRVTVEGEPVGGLSVVFTPASGGRPAFGRTDSDGRYQLLFSTSAMGAIVGPNRVEIRDDSGNAMPDGVSISRYTGKNSELSAEVVSGSNTFDFELSKDEEPAPVEANPEETEVK